MYNTKDKGYMQSLLALHNIGKIQRKEKPNESKKPSKKSN